MKMGIYQATYGQFQLARPSLPDTNHPFGDRCRRVSRSTCRDAVLRDAEMVVFLLHFSQPCFSQHHHNLYVLRV